MVVEAGSAPEAYGLRLLLADLGGILADAWGASLLTSRTCCVVVEAYW